MNKNRQNTPDEHYDLGPFEISRFGENTIFQSKLDDDQYDSALKGFADEFDSIVSDINELVDKISLIVSELPPEELLHRAWFQMALQNNGLKSEVESNSESILSLRMIDYIQSVIASFPPSSHVKQEISDEDWKNLNESVENLFDLINVNYHISHTAKRKLINPDIDMDEEEFYFRSQMYWCNVRGERYQIFQEAHLSDLLLTHSNVIEELFGINSESLIIELMKIQDSLMYGFEKAKEDMEIFQSETIDCAAERIKNGLEIHSEEEYGSLLRQIVSENNWESRSADIFGRLLQLDLFDVSKVTHIPEKLLSSLSFSQGEDNEFFSEGEYRGWPLRIWPIFKKPFIKLNGRYYCFDLNSLFDNFYRVMQRVIFFHKPSYKSEWNEKQKIISEELPFKYLNKLLPESINYRSVYYRSGVGKKGKMEWCETDGLIIYDDHLFVIEVKAGSFTYTSPTDDLPAYVKSIKGLVLSPSVQAQRFINYLSSNESVPIFDEGHNEIAIISKSDFRKITILPITLDSFTEIAAQIQHFKSIGVEFDETPVWSLSIDDLRVYSEVFNNPLIFLHFVEQRMRSFQSEVIKTDDELDHLGMYLKHNNYVSHANKLKDSPKTRVNFIGYRLDVDNYFSEKMEDKSLTSPLIQKMPARLMEIIDTIYIQKKVGGTRISSFLLDCADKGRKSIIDNIDIVLQKQKDNQRPFPLSLYGNVKLTVFCWQESYLNRDEQFVLDHSRASMLAVDDTSRLVIELYYSESGSLDSVDWLDICADEIPSSDLSRIEELANNLKTLRKSKIGKLGRNEPCCCGSGKKYKKCCIDLK